MEFMVAYYSGLVSRSISQAFKTSVSQFWRKGRSTAGLGGFFKSHTSTLLKILLSLFWMTSDAQHSLESSRELLKMPGSHSQDFDLTSEGARSQELPSILKLLGVSNLQSELRTTVLNTIPVVRITAKWSIQEWLRLLFHRRGKGKKENHWFNIQFEIGEPLWSETPFGCLERLVGGPTLESSGIQWSSVCQSRQSPGGCAFFPEPFPWMPPEGQTHRGAGKALWVRKCWSKALVALQSLFLILAEWLSL